MIRKVILSLLILTTFSGTAYTKDILIKVTPAKTITTAHKNSLAEGDLVDFKVTQGGGFLKNGDIVTGTVTKVTENGFLGKHAAVFIEYFTSQGRNVDGYIYLKGSEHSKVKEFAEQFQGFPDWVRGGEVIAKPDKSEFILHIKE